MAKAANDLVVSLCALPYVTMGTETKMTVHLMLCVLHQVRVGAFFIGVGAACVLGCEKVSVDVTISQLSLYKHSHFISGVGGHFLWCLSKSAEGLRSGILTTHCFRSKNMCKIQSVTKA